MIYFVALLSIIVGLALAAIVGFWVLRPRWRAEQDARDAEREAIFDAAVGAAVGETVEAVLRERNATAAAVAADRDQVVQHASTVLADVGGSALKAQLNSAQEHLSHQLARNDEQLDHRAQVFEKRAVDLDQKLAEMTQMMEALKRDNASRHGQLSAQLNEAAKRTDALRGTTERLNEVLASPKARGQWGERMAEDVLLAAGFKEGVNYRRQKQLEVGSGIPDFTFLLPGDLTLNMDVKFPIDNYVRYLDASDDAARNRASDAFARDVRQRVKEIADRGYIDPDRTVDAVLLFIPNEAVYTFLHANDDQLLDQALAQKVVLCSPSTLFSVLAVVRQSVESFKLERRSSEILSYLGEFRAEWTKFSTQVDKLGKQMATAQRSFDELAGARTNKMNKKLTQIDALEAPSIDASPSSGVLEIPLDAADPADEVTPRLRGVS